jgi:putative ABC transport system permease protein
MNTDLGFRLDHLAVMRLNLPASRYSKPEQLSAFNRQLIDRIRRLPGVRSAALTTALPMRSVQESSFELPGKTLKPGEQPTADWSLTTDDYFRTLGLPILKGRSFTRAESMSNAPQVAVVNRAFALLYWPNEDPIDKEIRFGDPKHTMKVIGVVGNERQMGPDQGQHPEFYIPSDEMRDLYAVVRTSSDPRAVLPALQEQVLRIDKSQPVELRTEEDALHEWVAPRRFNMTVLVAFGIAALVLASIGLYGVLAYSVSLRTRELGVRMALGAEPRRLAAGVVKDGLLMGVIGIAIGVCCALALTRFMQTVVFGVSTNDPITFVATPVLLLAIAVLASYIPAVRAARIDPVAALRNE